uniref:metallophosphoesterase family protein n=1 Tax=Eubacterium sp. TaxID=142586 RepID=UPI00402888F9
MNDLKFYLITDTHFFKNSLGARGDAYDDFMRFEQKCFAETQSINISVFDWLKNADEADSVLIAGDLTFNGEKESHLEFIKLLNELKASGKNVYVVTADHDFKKDGDSCFAFDENGRSSPQSTKREELYDLYYEFGFKDALAVDKKHLSYVSQIGEGVRLLALNNDGADDGQRRFDEEQIKWIKEQAKKAREDGQIMFAMNHYPLLPGQPIFSIVPSAVQKESDVVTTMLADEGVHLVFTGHMHNQSINEKITDRGNKIYDVCTGSIIADPAIIRHVTITSENKAIIKSIETPDFEWDTKGKSCKQYLSDLFDSMILNMLDDMQYNPERILSRFGARGSKGLFPVFKTVGKIINKITLGSVCRLLWIKCDKSLKHELLKNYLAELVRGVFEGNQTFVEGTPKGDVFISFLKRMNPVFSKINLKTVDGKKADLFDILKNSAGNYGIDDYNAVLDLN